MDTHENVDNCGGIGVDAGRNRKILFESCLIVRRRVHEFGAGNVTAGLVLVIVIITTLCSRKLTHLFPD